MSSYNPTIVAASLSDEELQKSINSLVNKVKEGTDKMKKYMTDAVAEMKKQLQSLGNVNITTGNASDGGSSRRTKEQNQEAKAVKETAVSYKQLAEAQQVAIRNSSPNSVRNADTLQTMNIQLDLLRERLREARQQYSSFVALSAHATTTGDKGLFQYATDGVHRYEQEVRNLIPKIRSLQAGIRQIGDVIAPQGHTIQNYVNSLQKTTQVGNKGLQEMGNYYRSLEKGIKQAAVAEQVWSETSKGRVNQTKQSLVTLNDYVEKNKQANIKAEQEKREQILQTGLVAQKTARDIAAAMDKQVSGGEQVTRINELTNAWRQMQQALNSMSKDFIGTPLGKALSESFAESIAKTELAITAVKKYNEELKKTAAAQQEGKKPSASYSELSIILKNLTGTYHEFNSIQRDSAKEGKTTAASIQKISRELQKIQAQMNRPVSLKAAIGLEEKTLDDIAYKIKQIQAYRQGMDISNPNNTKTKTELEEIAVALDKLKKKQTDILGSNKSLIESNNALGRSWNYMKNRLAFYFTVGASTQFVKNLIEVRSQYEMNERALGILINSAERGTQIFQELSQMALVSPYTLIELSSAAKQLTAYDIAAKDVVDTTRRLADMASAVGVPIERLTYALGQIKAYGYLNSRDARMFANAGIPLVKELSNYYTELEGKIVSVGDVYDRMKKKAIDYNTVMSVVTKMTDEGGKFFDFQAKMAGTLKVQLANLTLAWNNMLNDIGASEQGILTGGIGLLKDFFLHWQQISNIITKVAYAFGLYKLGQMAALIWTGRITTAMGVQELVGKKLQARLASLTASNASFVSAATAGWFALAAVVVDVFHTWSKNTDEIIALNKRIADGAKEAADSINKLINSSEMSAARVSAKAGKLPKADAEKTWEVMREQIELSSASSGELIPKLLAIKNLNQRLTEAFDVAEKIKDADNKLSDMYDRLDVSQNSILGGLLGEGLEEDIDDYNQHLKYISDVTAFEAKKNRGFWENVAMGLSGFFEEVRDALGDDAKEATAEIENFARTAAKSIKDELGEEGIKDKIQVNEAVARVVAGMEAQFPKIRGKGKILFETMFNDIMAEEFKGSVDRQAYYYTKFLEQLKKDHGSAFRQVTDGILNDTHQWSSVQMDAIQKTAEKVKTDLPLASQDAIDKILAQLNSTEFKLRIVAQFATTTEDEVSKAFRKRFIDSPSVGKGDIKTGFAPWSPQESREREMRETENLHKYGTLMKKNGESDLDYQKRIREEKQKQLDISKEEGEIIKNNTGKQEEGAKVVLANAIAAKKNADDWLKAADEVEDWGGYDFTTKKEAAAARKAQKAAESELQKTLKEELQLIDQVRSSYDKLTKAGVGHFEAIEASTQGFDRSVKNINKVLNKYGIALDLSKFAGTTNPHELVEMLQKQIGVLMKSPNAKPAEIQDLEVKVQKLGLDVKEFDHKKFTDSLNNELGRLKDEYELAVMLDADPEMGNMFADMIGININDLPRTVKEYADLYTKYLNEYLSKADAGFQLDNLNLTNDSLRALEERVKEGTLTQAAYEAIAKAVQDVRDKRKKDFEETTKEFNALIKKYGEYQAKMEEVRQTADKERLTFVKTYGGEEEIKQAIQITTEIGAEKDPTKKEQLRQQLIALVNQLAGDDATRLKLKVAIDTQQARGEAGVDFEEFQKSPEWVVATGDLAGMTNKAIGGLIDSLESYKKKSKNLDPKQIKQINSALKTLYRQQRSNNPFNVIGNAIMEAKERAAAFEPRIKEVKAEMDKITQDIAKGTATETQKKRLDELIKEYDDLNDKQQQAGKISATTVVEGINNAISAAQTAVSMFNQMAEALGGKGMTDASKTINRVANTLQMAGAGAATGAQIGGGWGAAIGAVAGGLAGVITNWADVWSGNADITDNIEESVHWVKVLQLEYKNLEYQLEKATGTGEVYYQRLEVANKQLQLAELKRQLALEESRKAKNRDQNTIDSLKEQIEDMEREIQDAVDNIVNDLLGISGVGDAAESMMDTFVEALRNGEDAMKAFDESIDDMIANMIKKLFVTKILQPWFEEQWNAIQNDITKRGEGTVEKIKAYKDMLRDIENGTQTGIVNDTTGELIHDKAKMQAYINKKINMLQQQLAEETTPTLEDIKRYAEMLKSGRVTIEQWYDYMNGVIGDLGLITDSAADKNLSALQQGIQGITETTAGALEAYMNGVSQQVYLQSTLMMQINETIQSFDIDVQTSTIGDILLQLQNSYQVQQSIQTILNGWSTPSGLAVRVEMN